jgi:plasmid stabilization system protein ParE
VKQAQYLPSARKSLKELRLYLTVTSGSRNVSRKFISRLRAYCDHLASLPFTMGIERPELAPDLRSSAFESYVIFFRYHQDAFQVVNIIEGHRDLPGYFSTTKPE